MKSISKSQRAIAIIAMTLGTCVLILTGSRNAWGLAILGGVALALYYGQWKLVAGFGFVLLIIICRIWTEVWVGR